MGSQTLLSLVGHPSLLEDGIRKTFEGGVGNTEGLPSHRGSTSGIKGPKGTPGTPADG